MTVFLYIVGAFCVLAAFIERKDTMRCISFGIGAVTAILFAVALSASGA